MPYLRARRSSCVGAYGQLMPRAATGRPLPVVTASRRLDRRGRAATHDRIDRPTRRAPTRRDAARTRRPRGSACGCSTSSLSRARALCRAQALDRQESGGDAPGGVMARRTMVRPDAGGRDICGSTAPSSPPTGADHARPPLLSFAHRPHGDHAPFGAQESAVTADAYSHALVDPREIDRAALLS